MCVCLAPILSLIKLGLSQISIDPAEFCYHVRPLTFKHSLPWAFPRPILHMYHTKLPDVVEIFPWRRALPICLCGSRCPPGWCPSCWGNGAFWPLYSFKFGCKKAGRRTLVRIPPSQTSTITPIPSPKSSWVISMSPELERMD